MTWQKASVERRTEEWLSEWTVVARGLREPGLVFTCNEGWCGLMQRAGRELFSLETLPEFAGTSAPIAFQAGTGGNFAIRTKTFSHSFVVTARGAHKGKLASADFVEVLEVRWERKIVSIFHDRDDILPSTDSLLVAAALETDPRLTTWVHFHKPVTTPYAVHLHYPLFGSEDRAKLTGLIKSGARVINMIDHNLFLKGTPDGTPDAAIILGEDPEATFELAKELIVKKK